jgi:small subunit ribosomal protein S4
MGHYTGPKARINRRLGFDIYDSAGALRASHRRPQPPGKQPTRRRRPTDYARALMEKQKIRHFYGLSQTQLERFFAIAKKQGGNKGEKLLLLCERRLDNVVWKAGLASTRAQARQSVAHGHFEVNGRRTDIPSFIVKEGDTIKVRARENLQKLYTDRVEANRRGTDSGFIAAEPKELLAKVVRLPDTEDIGLPVEIQQVVEFLSR